MKCDYIVALVRKDIVQETPVTVFPHELQILYEVHGESNVNVVDPYPDVPSVNLDPDEEYARLERRYGADAERNNTSFVELVYGKPFKDGLKDEMALGKNRIMDEDSDFEEPDLTETSLKKVDGLKARLKQIGASYPAAVKKKELEQILRQELIDRTARNKALTDGLEAGTPEFDVFLKAYRPKSGASLDALSKTFDEVA